MQLKPGTRLESTTCDTQVVVVKAPADDVDLRCGGAPMVEMGTGGDRTEPAAGFADGTLMGKRYAADEPAIELLCTKPGAGSLSLGETAIGLKDAKPLPASD